MTLLALLLLAALSSPQPPLIDGTIHDEEWAGARMESMEGGGTVRILTRGDRLFLAIEGEGRGIAHVCAGGPEGVSILHASAALGAVRYDATEGGWSPWGAFTWALREPREGGLPPPEDRDAYLASEGWLANASNRSSPSREFEIRLTPQIERIAVAFLSIDAEGVAYWPATVRDACTDRELLRGNTPSPLTFEPESWHRLP